MAVVCEKCGSDRIPCECRNVVCDRCKKHHPIDQVCAPRREHIERVTRAAAQILNDDPVNHPSHYQLFPGQEAIDIIRAALTDEEFQGYCKGNALKYRLRAGEKGDTQQDIDKSNWYRNRLTNPDT